MSSTQFNKGPSYGLSAEVKNRVSEGRPSPTPAPGGLAPSDFCRAARPAGLPEIWGAVALAPGARGPSSPAPGVLGRPSRLSGQQ